MYNLENLFNQLKNKVKEEKFESDFLTYDDVVRILDPYVKYANLCHEQSQDLLSQDIIDAMVKSQYIMFDKDKRCWINPRV